MTTQPTSNGSPIDLRQYLDTYVGGVTVDEGLFTAVDEHGNTVTAVEWSARTHGPDGSFIALSLPNARAVREVVLQPHGATFGSPSAASSTLWDHHAGRHVVIIVLPPPYTTPKARDWARSAFDALLHDPSTGLRLVG